MSVVAAIIPSAPPQKVAALHVRFFGPVRALVRRDGWEMPWPAEGASDAFWSGLLHRFPEIASVRAGIRLARNGEFLNGTERLQPGDEIALIPPVSGG